MMGCVSFGSVSCPAPPVFIILQESRIQGGPIFGGQANFSSDAVNNLTAHGIDVYMPPGKIGHRLTLPPAPRGRIPKSLSIADRMRRKLRTKKGRECYGLRKELPEPVFGQIKQTRGFRQFLLRGSGKVSSEWKVICTGHNLLKLFKAREGLLSREFLDTTFE